MLQELKTLRRKIATEILICEKDLFEARNSAALGGNSRAFLLYLHRKVQGSKKQLALLDAQLESISARRLTRADDSARAPAEAKTTSHNRRRPLKS
jgi:hypothetical protein